MTSGSEEDSVFVESIKRLKAIQSYLLDIPALTSLPPEVLRIIALYESDPIFFFRGLPSSVRPLHESDCVTVLATLSSDRIASGDTLGALTVWNMSEASVRSFAWKAHAARVHSLAALSANVELHLPEALVSSGSDCVRVWNASDGTLIQALKHEIQASSSMIRPSLFVCVLPGSELVSVSADGSLKLWSASSSTSKCQWHCVREAELSFGAVVSPCALSNNRFAVATCDGLVHVFSSVTGAQLCAWNTNSTLFSKSRSFPNLTDFTSLTSPQLSALAYHSISDTLAVGFASPLGHHAADVKLFHVSNGQCFRVIHCGDGVEALCVLSNNQLVASHGSGDMSVWDPHTGECERQWTAHNAAIHSVVEWTPSSSCKYMPPSPPPKFDPYRFGDVDRLDSCKVHTLISAGFDLDIKVWV